ncbi:MAG: CRISPR-associated endonuclease Cas3'' [Gallionella sp.]|nr:CRISPR-associated endonuclease Cas3'' [Gallionella sp.]
MAAMNNETESQPLAHVRQDKGGNWHEHLLDEHLREVANLAGKFAEHFDSKDWASLAGLWHDLGKFSSEFQRYIKTVSGYDAHIEGVPGRVDHSTAGVSARPPGWAKIEIFLSTPSNSKLNVYPARA